MGLYSPPPGNENNNKNKYQPSNDDDDNKKPTDIAHFYPRPSIGLRLWGPLVPASDCTWGLWLLTGTQVTIGYYFLRKFRLSIKQYFLDKPITKQIKDIPSLNRFSNESKGTIQYSKTSHAGGNLINRTGQMQMGNFGGTQSFHMQRQYTKWEILMNRYKKSTAYKYVENFKRFGFLLLGTVLTSFSILEATRLLLLDYDPWAEQAKIARDQKFYNDASEFYREGVDPSKTRIRVKDQGTGKLVDVTNDDSLKRNIALARAGLLQNDWLFEWFGPFDLKPLTFNEFLTHIEHYEVNKQALLESRNKEPLVHMLKKEMKSCKAMELGLYDQNKKNRDMMSGIVESKANLGNFNSNSPLSDVASQLSTLNETNSINSDIAQSIQHKLGAHVNSTTKSNVVILPPNARNEDQISIIDTWEANEPWTALGLSLDVTVKVVPYSRNELMRANDDEEE